MRLTLKEQSECGMFCPGWQKWDVMSGVTKAAWDVISGVTKTAWDVLSGVANLCGMFCPGWQKMTWDVLSRDVLYSSAHVLL